MSPERFNLPRSGPQSARGGHVGRAWLGILFRCCHVYGRIYKNAQGTRYEGGCPRCGAPVSAAVGPDGTNRRFFEAE